MGREVEPVAQREEILRRLAEGEGLATICATEGWPRGIRQKFLRECDEDRTLMDRYMRAKIKGVHALADQILSIADTPVIGQRVIKAVNTKGQQHGKIVEVDCVERSRLRIEARKWYCSKIAPKLYGDRLLIDPGTTDRLSEVMAVLKHARADVEAEQAAAAGGGESPQTESENRKSDDVSD